MTTIPVIGLPAGTEVRVFLRGETEPTRAEVRCFIPAWCGRGAYSVLVWEGPLAGQCATVPARRVSAVGRGGR